MQFDRQNANIISKTSTNLPDAEGLFQRLTVKEQVATAHGASIQDQGQLQKASAHH